MKLLLRSALGLVIVIALLLTVPWFIPKSVYLGRVTGWVEARYPVELQVADAHLGFLPRVTVRLDDIRLTMKGEKRPLVSCRRFAVDAAWADLLARRSVFGLFAKGVEAHLVETSPDRFNYDPLLSGTSLRRGRDSWLVREAWAESNKAAMSVRSLRLQEATIFRKPYGDEEQKIYLSNLEISPRRFSSKSFDWEVDGRLDDLQVAGTGDAEISDKLKLSSRNLSLNLPGRLALKKEKVSFASDYAKAGDRTEIRNGLLKVGPQAFSVSGSQSKKGRLDLTLASDRLDLDYLKKILPGLRQLPPVRDVGLKARYASERGGKPTISGHLTAANVRLPDQEFQNLAASFVYRDPVLRVQNLKAGTMDGTVAGSAEIGMTPQNERYDFDLSLKDIAMDRVSSVGKLVQGRGDLAVRGRGKGFDEESFARSLNGDGNLSVRRVRIPALKIFETVSRSPAWEVLKRIPGSLDERALASLSGLDSKLNDLAAAFQIVGGVVHLPRIALRFPQASAVLNGGVGFDKSLNFSGDLSLDRALVARFVKNPKLLSALTSSGPLVVPIRITGKATAPVVVPDLGVVRSRLEAAVRKGVEEKARSVVKDAIEKKQLPPKEELPTKDEIRDFMKKF